MTPPSPSEIWLLWRDTARTPACNMAIDDLLLETLPERALPLLRLYRWDRPAVTIGRAQRFPEELTGTYEVIRRPTGGGVVFHDADLTYTLVFPAGHRITRLNRQESYRIIHEALQDALTVPARLQECESENVDRRTMCCFVSPSRYDVIAPDGGKYAGAAQRRTRKGLLHQGSIQLSAVQGNRELLEQLLPAALSRRFNFTWQLWSPDSAWLQRAAVLAAEQYAGTSWNREKYAG